MAPIRVLLADDVPDMRLLVQIALERNEGFEVVGHAGDGEQAVQLAGELKPDVVVLDMAMPKLDGLQAIPLIHKAAPGVRILVLSGFAGETISERAISSCASAYLEKGVPYQEIVNGVRSVFNSPPKVCAPV